MIWRPPIALMIPLAFRNVEGAGAPVNEPIEVGRGPLWVPKKSGSPGGAAGSQNVFVACTDRRTVTAAATNEDIASTRVALTTEGGA